MRITRDQFFLTAWSAERLAGGYYKQPLYIKAGPTTTTLLSAMVDKQHTWTRAAMLPLQLLCVQTSHMTGMGGEKHIHILQERLAYLEQSNTTGGLK